MSENKKSVIDKIREAGPKQILADAQKLLSKGEREHAFKQYLMLSYVYPKTAEAHYNPAAIYLNEDKHLASLAYALNAHEIELNNPLYAVTAATALAGIGGLSQAAKIIEPVKADGALGQLATNLKTQIKKAQDNDQQHETEPFDEKKLQHFHDTEDLSSKNLEQTLVSMLLNDLGKWETWHWLYRTKMRQQELIEAESALQRALYLNPKSPQIISDFGAMIAARGDNALAAKILINAVDDLGPTIEVAKALGPTLVRMGKKKRYYAEEAFDELAPTLGDEPHFLLIYATIKDNVGKIEESQKLVVKAAEAIKSDPDLIFKIGMQLIDYGLSGEVKKLIARSKRLHKQSALIDTLEAILAYKQKKYQEVVDTLTKLQGQRLEMSYVAKVQFIQAQAYDKLGNYEAAFASFKRGNEYRTIQDSANDRYSKQTYLTRAKTLENNAELLWGEESLMRLSPPKNFPRVDFIYGMPRSGTTLLDTLLRGHGDLTLFEEEPFMATSINDFLGKNYDISRLKAVDANRLSTFYKNYRDQAEEFADTTFGPTSHLIDRHPYHTPSIGIGHQFFPEAKHIFIARHPLDVVLSCFMQDFQMSDINANFAWIERCVVAYQTILGAFRASVEAADIPVYILRYEDLVADTEGEMRKLIGHLDIEWRDSILDNQKTAAGRERIRTASSDQVTQPIYKTASYRWKNYRFALDKFIPQLQPWIDYFDYEV